MKLKISQYIKKGDFENERIAFKVEQDCDLQFFAVHISTITDNGGFYNKPRHTFWFPPTKVKTGDWVVLYTKKGKQSEKINNEGNLSHFFYWGLEHSILNTTKDGVILAQINTWQTSWDDD